MSDLIMTFTSLVLTSPSFSDEEKQYLIQNAQAIPEKQLIPLIKQLQKEHDHIKKLLDDYIHKEQGNIIQYIKEFYYHGKRAEISGKIKAQESKEAESTTNIDLYL